MTHDPTPPAHRPPLALAEALSTSRSVALVHVDASLAVLDSNPAARDALGAPLAAGDDLARVVVREDADRLRAALASGGDHAGPFLLRSSAAPGDEEAALLLSVVAVPDRSGVGGFALLGRSAAPDLRREARILRARRFEIVGQLTGGIAHDLNNRLSTVTTFSDLLLGDFPPGSQEAEDLAEIKTAGLDSATITRKLDLFAGGHAGGATHASIADVVRDFEKLIRRFLGSTIALTTEYEPDCPEVPVAPIRIEEALIALVANARDSMPDGGTLTLRVFRDGRGEDGGSGRVALEVVDTGSGDVVPPVERALEPFFSTREGALGSGLGLATVHGILQDAGGTFHLTRDEGHTRVRLTFPAAAEDGVGDEVTSMSGRAGEGGGMGRGPVGLIEPDAAQRSALTRALEREGFDVRAAADHATLMAQGDGHAAVVVDVEGRPGAGWRILEALRSGAPERPVILLRRRTSPRITPPGTRGVTELAKPTHGAAIREALTHLGVQGAAGT